MMGDDSQEGADDDHLKELNDILEPLPDSWLAKWPRSHLYFGPNRERLNPIREEVDIGDDDDQNAEHMETPGGEGDNEDGGTSTRESDREDASDGGDFVWEDPLFAGDGPFVNEPLEVLVGKNKPANMSPAEAQVVTSLIRQILRYEPSDRPTATQLLQHEWFQD
jgi:non-specific serine/threonine protein kinase